MVSDMERAVTFYRDVLGLVPGYQSTHYSSFSLDPITLGLHLGESGQPGGGMILGVAVDDLNVLQSILNAAGIATEPFHDVPTGTVMDFCDPDGNRLQAFQAK